MAEPILTRLNLFISSLTAKKARMYAIHLNKDLSKFTEEALEEYMKSIPNIKIDLTPNLNSRRIVHLVRRIDNPNQQFELTGLSHNTNGVRYFINAKDRDGKEFSIEGEDAKNYIIISVFEDDAGPILARKPDSISTNVAKVFEKGLKDTSSKGHFMDLSENN